MAEPASLSVVSAWRATKRRIRNRQARRLLLRFAAAGSLPASTARRLWRRRLFLHHPDEAYGGSTALKPSVHRVGCRTAEHSRFHRARERRSRPVRGRRCHRRTANGRSTAPRRSGGRALEGAISPSLLRPSTIERSVLPKMFGPNSPPDRCGIRCTRSTGDS